ncbi:MAG: endonuclease domain-containing protein [Patescibacteria group bacterium]
MPIIPYNRKFKQRAQDLRKGKVLSEVLLWEKLKQKKMNGLQFFRQRPVDNYILDFYCPEIKLAIEIDGGIHKTKIAEDKFRQGALESFGIQFLRFSDIDIEMKMADVLKKIKDRIENAV